MTDARKEWAPAPERDAAIEIEGLVVNYGRKRAVDGLSLTVPRGAVYGFLGPNGAGKTSTLKTLMGYRKPDGGSAKVLGYDVVEESLEVRARVGFASEVNSLYEGMTVPRICRLCRDLSRSWDQDLVDRYIGVFGLPGDAKIRKLSKGQKAQLQLCLALGSDPEVLGYDIFEDSLEVRARVGFASEVNSLYEGMTVSRICRLCRDLSREWDQDLVDRYMGVFGLPGDVKVRKLSKGQKAQLQLCLALGSNPELLILDEPTSGLDPVARRAFLKVLVGDVAAEGRTVFFSTHLLSDIEAVADTVGIIKGGKLLANGDLDEMRGSHRVFRAVYAQAPPEEEVRDLRSLPDVRGVEREGRGIKLRVRGDVEAVERGLRDRPYPVVDVDSMGMTLEDIFVAYVEDEDGR